MEDIIEALEEAINHLKRAEEELKGFTELTQDLADICSTRKNLETSKNKAEEEASEEYDAWIRELNHDYYSTRL